MMIIPHSHLQSEGHTTRVVFIPVPCCSFYHPCYIQKEKVVEEGGTLLFSRSVIIQIRIDIHSAFVFTFSL